MIAVIFEVWPAEGRKGDTWSWRNGCGEDLVHMDGFVSVERFQSLTARTSCCRCLLARREAVAAWRNQARIARRRPKGERHFPRYRLRSPSVLRGLRHDRDREQRSRHSRNCLRARHVEPALDAHASMATPTLTIVQRLIHRFQRCRPCRRARGGSTEARVRTRSSPMLTNILIAWGSVGVGFVLGHDVVGLAPARDGLDRLTSGPTNSTKRLCGRGGRARPSAAHGDGVARGNGLVQRLVETSISQPVPPRAAYTGSSFCRFVRSVGVTFQMRTQ